MNCAVSIFVSGNNSDKIISIFKDMEIKQKENPLIGYRVPDVGISSLYAVQVWDRNNVAFYTRWGITVGEIHKLAMKLKVTYLELSWEVAGDKDAGGFAIFENGFKTVEQNIYLSDYIAIKFNDGSVQDILGNMWESESLLLEYILRNRYGLKMYCDSTEPETFDIWYSFKTKGYK